MYSDLMVIVGWSGKSRALQHDSALPMDLLELICGT